MGIVDVGVGKLKASTIDGWFPENDVFGIGFVSLVDVLCSTKPYQVDHAEAVGEMRHHSLVALSRVELLEAENLSFDLYERHLRGQLADVEHLGAVYIFIRVVFQQVTIGADAELLAQYLFLLRTYARQVHDVLV